MEVAAPPSAISPAQQPGAEPGATVLDGSGSTVLQSQSQTMTLDNSFIGGIDSSPIVKQPVHDAGSSTRSAAKPATSGLATPQSLSYQKTYYIYSHGGKLNVEYHPMSDKYFYYTADQINSTRVVTDPIINKKQTPLYFY